MIYKLYYELKQKAPFEVLFAYMQQYDSALAFVPESPSITFSTMLSTVAVSSIVWKKDRGDADGMDWKNLSGFLFADRCDIVLQDGGVLAAETG